MERKELTSSKMIKCSGFLDGTAAYELGNLFNELLAGNKKNFIFDFSGVIKISEKAVDLFVDFARKLNKKGKHLFIIKLNPNLMIRKNLKLISDLEKACLAEDEDGLTDVVDDSEQLFCF